MGPAPVVRMTDALQGQRGAPPQDPQGALQGLRLTAPDSSGRRPAQDISPTIEIDDGLLLNQLAAWAPDAAVRRKILVDNPARLYGFG